jgi:acyl-CoA thioesterase-1
LLALGIAGCQSEGAGEHPAPRAAQRAAEPDRPKIVALGDSLTAGLGINLDRAYPARLQERLDSEGYAYEVINAGVSGDTSAGGLSRLDWVLEGDVRILILALGANDGLRGLPVSEMKQNLSTIIERTTERQIAVLLAGMEAPPNLGETYTSQFRETFAELAAEYEVVFFPFLLRGVAGIESLNQADGIHPNAQGARVIAGHLWSYLRPMLSRETES